MPPTSRLLLVPGFSQPASAWTGVVDELSTRAPALDARPVDVPDGLDFTATADALVAREPDPVLLVGYSMGGRLALRAALDRSERVGGLVLVSATPGIDDPAARAARAAADAGLADEVVRDGVAAFLDRWLAQPLFAGIPAGATHRDERVAGTSVARLVHQLTTLGQGAMPPLWPRLGELAAPLLLVTGERDEKYGAIADDVHGRVRAAGGASRHAVVAGGHAVLLEQPAALAAEIARFAHDALPTA